MTDRLKPCPFCGGEAEVIMLSDVGNVGVGCKKCSAVVGEYRFWKRPYAIKVWNTRKPMDRIVEQLKEASFVDDGYLLLDLAEAIEIVKAGGKDED